ncbi:hypothetical protein EJ03DRAFT_8967 [Teratosphaeria nubilosa]|uniref:C2H2-type domain-containing protein n=1 Tax=Teratosphaeria nubilosa TaxID=161662 RepID=A0A6G1LPK9_9PEZI|nr:hypothetical protein EJ03DRAFT_8967 [Teratosphaeria nubilosa]
MSPVTRELAAASSAPGVLRADENEHRRPGDGVAAACEDDELDDGKPRKKRKLVKNGDKKYQCPHEECGKAYSRAEHLYRHQLNHTPKQIYRCDFPGCDRHFVRADLCARHRERHTAKGSHLQRKDAFLNSQRTAPNPSSATTSGDLSAAGNVSASPPDTQHAVPPPAFHEQDGAAHVAVQFGGAEPYRSNGFTNITSGSAAKPVPVGQHNGYTVNHNGVQHAPPSGRPISPPSGRPYGSEALMTRPLSQMQGFNHQQRLAVTTMQPPPPLTSPPDQGGMYANPPYPSPTTSAQQFRSPTNYSMLPSLPPFAFPQAYAPQANNRLGNMMSPPLMGSAEPHPVPNNGVNGLTDFNVIDQMNAGYAMPVFGNDGFDRSPAPIVDDTFINSLFNVTVLDLSTMNTSPPGPEPMYNPQVFNTPLPKLDQDGVPAPQEPLIVVEPKSPCEGNGMDITIRESDVSEKKRQRLYDLVNSWSDIDHNPGRRTKAEILKGDTSDDHHVLSLHMLKTYLTSYWTYIHQQMPILHRPTFNAQTCPDLLLLAMMCLGATCLERNSPAEWVFNSSELSFFIAYHVRWEVFKDAEFRPTAKLWTFQTMLLLELFEKMYSTRTLHERAHIHHATTLTVMRRGSSLIGRSAELSSCSNDPTRTPPGPDGSINTSGQNTPDAYWNQWITAEATRRVAFAAFIIDSTHATLFGHSAVMAPHDLKLPLPCDEALWSATSSAEVQRVEASLAANGFKPTSFLDGIKRTLNGQKVRTNTFGRVILMAGLLNVSWHLNQRDLQVSSLGVQNTLGNQIKWRGPLTRAFDFWRRDFDESLSKNGNWLEVCNPKANDRNSIDARNSVFESRTCLHSLAHMAMHVDMIDCEVFGGSDRVLGRLVTDADRAAVVRRMREQWAPSARARDATFYALRFLVEVLIPEEDLASKRAFPHQPPAFTYNARDDYLLNRPWILFFAILIVWSYGYALDGPIRPSNYTLTTRELQIHDMQRYLIRMGGVASPDDLEKLKDRNSCLGLLLLLRDSLRQPRWELLHEASDILSSCIDLLLPGHDGGETATKQGAQQQ